ncbi:MAG: DUF2306 domain-containing protein [Alphaproteobacteria bacterium]|nr:DUF2306 domain-containing protein [Alphaproteobacteria bacterium]
MFGSPDAMVINPVIISHAIAAVFSLGLGAVVLTRKKGTRHHKLLGRIWAGLMLYVAVTSFWIGESFSYIHGLSIWVIFGMIMAVISIRVVKGKRGLASHKAFMIGNYIGLWSAAIPAFVTEGRVMHHVAVSLLGQIM